MLKDYKLRDDIPESKQKDEWKNESKTAERNYEQEEMVNNTVRVYDNKYIHLVGLFCILLILILAIDGYNTYTHQNRTIINTIVESIGLLFQ